MKTAGRAQKTAARRAWVDTRWALALALLAANSTVAARDPDPTVTVRLYNYARVPSGVLGGALSEATRIFSAAGVDLVWLDCVDPWSQSRLGSASTEPAGKAGCDGQVRGATVVLQILPRSTPVSKASPDAMFGFATGSDLAAVFYGRVQDLAWGAARNEIPLILGAVMAHELGHLLLGANSHSPSGIMCAKWDREYVRLALRGYQHFSPEQSASLREAVVRRQKGIVQP